MIGFLGIALLLLAAFALCDNRKAIRWRTVGTALGLQVLIGWVVFAVPAGRDALAALSAGVTNAIGAGQEGVDFLIGGLGGMAPNRRSEIARLGLLAVAAGTFSNLTSAAIVGQFAG